LIISVLQNHSRSFSSFLSVIFADYTHEKAENRSFLGVLQNESKLYWPVFPLFLSILRSISSNKNAFFTKRIPDSFPLSRNEIPVGRRPEVLSS
jgi:Gpi18-like mannosyltransferase